MTQPKTVVGLGRDIEFTDSWDLAQVSRLWSSAAGPELAMSQRMVRYYVGPAEGVWQSGRFAEVEGRPVGLVWITTARRLNRDDGLSGFVEMLCVVSEYQGRGIGTRLLGWAEDMLADQACERIVLGGGFRYPVNCLPLELGSQDYFRGRGYLDGVAVWDVARDLVGFEADYEIGEDDVSIVEASEADHAELFEFLASTYPRWAIELTDFHQGRGRFSDYVVLRVDGRLQGFCQLTFEDSRRPLERFLGSPLPRPWGELGPIGLTESVRGRGLGRALLREGLAVLRSKGVRGCRILWTPVPGFFETAGFQREREFVMMSKDIRPK